MLKPVNHTEYVVDKNGKVVARCKYKIDEADVASRQEKIVISQKDIPLHEAKYINGKIERVPFVHVKTAEEKEEEMIYHEVYESARRKLVKEGKLKIRTKEKPIKQ